MTFTVREVDVKTSQADLLGLLGRHFDEWTHESASKFQWLYLDNPFGPARAWILENESGELLGLSAAFPRRLRMNSRAVDGWVLGDFCVDRALRSLGPALLLQRAICAAIDRKESEFWYDFPSRSMLAVYGRMGLRPAGEMVRLVYPLRVDAMMANNVQNPVVASGLSVVGNVVLSTRDALRRRDPSVEVRSLEGAFPPSAGRWHGGRSGVLLERTSEYLDWRYRRDPRGATSVLAACREGTCGGFLVFRAHGERHAIVDAFGIQGEEYLKQMVLEVIERARDRRASRVTAGLSRGHPWLDVFERLGFHRREGAPYVVHTGRRSGASSPPWFLTNGDRDL